MSATMSNPTPAPIHQIETPVAHGKKIGIVGSILLILIASVTLVIYRRQNANNALSTTPTSPVQSIVFVPSPTPTPFAFAELTIPYLRNRSYTSQLGELKQVSINQRYTSFITSYDSDGLTVNGLLTQPQGTKPVEGWPAVIFIHGYIPPQQYRTTQNYASYVDYLARNGLVVFKIDLRGHDQSEGEASGAYYSSDYIIDTLNAYAALQQADFINPHAIGLWGHSMAGNVVFRSFAAKQDIPAIVIWAGAVYSYEDMQEFGIDDNSYQQPPSDSDRQRKRQLLREIHGDFDKSSSFWQQVVPTNYLEGVTGAVQIHHAINDAVVNIDYSRNLMKLLDNTTVEHELLEYQSGGHNLTGSSFTESMQRTVEFYKDKLRGNE